MATKTDIANLAISNLGIGKTISDFDADESAEAKAVRTFYDHARDSLLEWAPWPFAKEQAALGLLTADPSDAWGYSYTYPSDAIRFLRIINTTSGKDVTFDQLTPFRIFYGSASKEIWTNEEDAVGEYIISIDEPARYSASFTTALSYLLASMAAPRITGGDNFNLVKRSAQMFQMARNIAAQHAFNEEERGAPPDNEFIRARR